MIREVNSEDVRIIPGINPDNVGFRDFPSDLQNFWRENSHPRFQKRQKFNAYATDSLTENLLVIKKLQEFK
ncbi:unnamed protein product [Dracunculus medinensis]|uniref:Succinylglutamate desuccinylase n=1 Tax=Dracunculus medinensis TaxID=318479 RepID=A0A0N4UQH9_DRAME|nr:unnamed protein product [Dracunculus medinensis]